MKMEMKRDENAEEKEGRLRRIYGNDREKTEKEGNTEMISGENENEDETKILQRF